MLDWLRADIQGADGCAATGHLGLISRWLQADSSVRVAWGQAEATAEEGRKVAGLAAAACDAAQKDAATAEERCRTAEAELKALRDGQVARARQLEAQEKKLKA